MSRKHSKKGSSSKGRNTPDNAKERVDAKNASTKDEVSEQTQDERKVGRNDAAWYARDPQLLQDAARINWTYPFGAGLRYGFDYKTWAKINAKVIVWAADHKDAIPGIVTLRTAPSMGASTNIKDPANMAAQSLYTMVRYVNAGRKNYDAPDLLIYMNAVTDMYAFIVFCERLYAYAFQYSQTNFYLGKDLISACGVEPESIIQRLADFRYYINALINKVSTYALPAEVPMAAKRVFQYQTYYIENGYGNLKDQLYQFAPSHFYQFGYDSTGAGCLNLKEWYTVDDGSSVIDDLKSLDQLMLYGEELLNAFWGDEDFGLMSGDILKAFQSNIVNLTSMADDYTVLPIYDPFVLSQFKNAKIVSIKGLERYELPYIKLDGTTDLKAITNGGVYQAPNGCILAGYAVGDPACMIQAQAGTLLSSENPTPDVSDTIEAVQLCYSVLDKVACADDNTEYTGDGMLISTFGYVAIECTVYYHEHAAGSTSGSLLRLRRHNWTTAMMYLGGSEIGTQTARFISNFKYLPMMFSITTSQSETQFSVDECKVLSNIDNYTVVPASAMARLAEVSLLSLLYVPGVAKYMNY